MKFMPVAIVPIAASAPCLCIDQAAIVSIANPMKSQRMGNPVRLKTIGEKIELSTPHKAAPLAMAAISRTEVMFLLRIHIGCIFFWKEHASLYRLSVFRAKAQDCIEVEFASKTTNGVLARI
jgi:hypothetical protein